MGNLKHIAIILIASALLIAGLAYIVQMRDGAAPEILLSADEELQGPLSPEVLESKKPEAITNDMNRTAIFTTNKGTFTLELYEDRMPVTTGNFIKLAQEGFYDNTKFHRVIEGFMIQAGDPNSKASDSSGYGTGGPGYTIADEFVSAPGLTNVRGTIAMANTGQPNSGGSQFFINTADNTSLDFDKEPLSSKHPVFGRVIEGMDVIDTISAVETGARDIPVEPVVIESVTIN